MKWRPGGLEGTQLKLNLVSRLVRPLLLVHVSAAAVALATICSSALVFTSQRRKLSSHVLEHRSVVALTRTMLSCPVNHPQPLIQCTSHSATHPLRTSHAPGAASERTSAQIGATPQPRAAFELLLVCVQGVVPEPPGIPRGKAHWAQADADAGRRHKQAREAQISALVSVLQG